MIPFSLLVLTLLPLLCPLGHGKMCTNTGVSHTLRSQLLAAFDSGLELTSTASSWNTTTATGSLEFSRRRVLQQQRNNSFLEAVSLHDVRLLPDSWQAIAQQTNLDYLLMLDVDNLVYSFRTTAGLNASGSAYGGWELPTSELRGHFVGHYLSASAMTWASTHNLTIYENMNAVVAALAECQAKIGTGYLSAFPTSLFDRFEALESVWAPYYTIHKIMAGLLDQYTYAANSLAFEMLLGMTDYFGSRVERVIEKYSIERHWQSLNEETGGMNDVLYRVYQITGDAKHLKLAHLFDKPCFLGLLAVRADSISGFHANTHIPIVIGAQLRYEVVGDKLYKDLSEYFMKIVSSSHTYATGGTSAGEFWSDPSRLGDTLGTENEESCTTYNMLKVARNLFRWTKQMHYADFYERALINGVLTIQRGKEPGVMIYMLPLAPGSSKATSYHGWGTPFSSFWCCYGTAIESFSKLGDSIYFTDEVQDTPQLYVIQYLSSKVLWTAAGLSVDQRVYHMTSTDPVMTVTFNFTQKLVLGKTSEAKLSVRVPYWAQSSRCLLNGLELQNLTPGTFFDVSREWKTGDKLSFTFSAMLRLEKIQDERSKYSSLYAIYYGPYLLAGMSDGNYKLGSVNVSTPSRWIKPVRDSNLFSFTQLQQGKLQYLAASSDGALSMISKPQHGSEEAPLATFRLKLLPSLKTIEKFQVKDVTSLLLDREVSLELLNRPGRFVTHFGIEDGVRLTNGKSSGFPSSSSVFKLRSALSGHPGEISFEASGIQGCFLVAQGRDITLECERFNKMAASFGVTAGRASYHPMSFEAYGDNDTYLMFPLSSYSDEKYAVYFEVTPS
ncbi:uncharacterized protein LOC9659119 isoform X1 [Selaginella moellendorffii]|uniref:uncharacterized protein LOC9659119 isoform X1 n=1 Tax=Selaginella moellendorffii TaxID=88036 RepID=UPI000D1CDBA3|nr:uncharacterized protein LOC9659119 isoform X1 [Selaginella moellendorffii]|eukprot:XP_024520409.1 uncharacterized protein LOC9659119 isoform X1 [Selaginella moellendorffii]